MRGVDINAIQLAYVDAPQINGNSVGGKKEDMDAVPTRTDIIPCHPAATKNYPILEMGYVIDLVYNGDAYAQLIIGQTQLLLRSGTKSGWRNWNQIKLTEIQS